MALPTPVAVLATNIPACLPVANDVEALARIGEFCQWPKDAEDVLERFDALTTGLITFLKDNANQAHLRPIKEKALPFRKITLENHGNKLLLDIEDHTGRHAYLRFDWYQEEQEVGGSFTVIGQNPDEVLKLVA